MPGAVSETPVVAIRGLREFNQAIRKADRQTKRIIRDDFRGIAEPVRIEAQQLASTEIRNIGPRWPLMRIGLTQKLLYVAPQQRGRLSRKNPALHRPNLGTLLMERAMSPALERNRAKIEHRIEQALDRIADDFNH